MLLPTCLLCVCLRGSVYCDDNKLTKIPSLPRDTSYFYARYNTITSVEKKDFEGLDKLRRVNLSNNRIKSVDPGTFDGLPVLEELLISNNDLTELPGLPISLVTLAANWNSIIDSGLPSDGLAKLENLKDLYLGNNQLEHVPHGLPENLQLLHLQHNKIDSIANDTFCKPGDKTYVRKSLQDVRLDNNPVLLGSVPDAYICLRRLPTGQF
uniref:Mimecan n=1 Tax=Eptatretus burgeri TaxID=7764 RepID=A0A8C4NLI4_EPTBU